MNYYVIGNLFLSFLRCLVVWPFHPLYQLTELNWTLDPENASLLVLNMEQKGTCSMIRKRGRFFSIEISYFMNNTSLTTIPPHHLQPPTPPHYPFLSFKVTLMTLILLSTLHCLQPLPYNTYILKMPHIPNK